MRRFKAVLFDLGGTLMYFDSPWPEVLAEADTALWEALKKAGLELEEKSFLKNYRAQLEAYYQERDMEFIEYTTLYVLRTLLEDWGYPKVPDQVLRPALNATYAITQAHWQPEVEAVPMLQALQAQGYRLGLLSNAADDLDVQTLVNKGGFRPYFERIMTSAEIGVRKPNPRIFQKMLHELNIPAEQAVMVGDTLGADILGARNAGLAAVWVTRRANTAANRAHADTIHPDAVIESLSELPDLLSYLDG